jgi:hypothetical protein
LQELFEKMNLNWRSLLKSVLVVFLCIALSACSPKQEQATAKRGESATIIVPTSGPVSSDPAKPEAAALQFASAPPAQIAALTMADGGKCSIDSINGKESDTGWSIRRDELMTVGGWVLDLATKSTSDWAILRLDAADGTTHFYAPTTVRGERADLYKAFGDGPGMPKATFTLVVAPDRLPPGSYKLVLLHQSGQAGQACAVSKKLDIVS